MANSSGDERGRLAKLEQIPSPAIDESPTPDEFTKKEQDRLARAKAHAKLTAPQMRAMDALRYHDHMAESLDGERAERKRLQAIVDELGPRCRSLESIQQFDAGISFWSAIVAAIGNGLMAYGGFHDSEKYKGYYLLAGLLISGIATLFILGVHKLWMPKAQAKASSVSKS